MTAISKEELQQLLDDGYPPKEIAEMKNISHQHIYRLMSKFGIVYHRRTKYTETELRHIQDLYNQGLSMERTAQEMNLTYGALSWVTRRYHLTPQKTKKTSPKLMQIRSQYFTEHKSISEIATIWGTTEEEMYAYMSENRFFSKSTQVKKHGVSEPPKSKFDDWFHTCPVCNKQFAVRECSSYAYKIVMGKEQNSKTYYFCSWTCIQKYRTEHPSKRKKVKH